MLMHSIRMDLDAHKRKYVRDQVSAKNNSSITLALINPCFAIVFYYRLYSHLYKSKNKFTRSISILLYYLINRLYGCDIHPAATIGVPLKVGHCSDIVIGPLAVVGENCYIFNGVTIGNKYVGEMGDMPIIGSNTIIGTGSKILGGCHIGSYSTVGALTLVINDVPENSTVVGIPGRVID
jgi:serine O-acetyltransferase